MMPDDDEQLQHDTEAFERAFERPSPKSKSTTAPPPADDAGDDEGGDDAEAATGTRQQPEAHPDRDERGRFRKRGDGEGDEGEAEGGPREGGDGEPREAIPAWRLREVAEERRQLREQMTALQRERDQYRERAAAYERQQRELQRQRERPDFLTNPQGYHDWMEEQRQQMREEFRTERRAERINESFETLREKDPERFQRAFATLCRAGEVGDPIFERVRNAPQPGRALMKWFGDLEVLHEIGGDINGFRQKEAERLMQDPEFRKKAMDAWRGQANGDGRERSSGNVRNLPSLNRVIGSGGQGQLEEDDEQRDGGESFRRAFDPKPTRRHRAG